MSTQKKQHPLFPIFRMGAFALAFIIIPAAIVRYLLPHDLHVWVLKPLYGDYVPQQLDALASIPWQELLHRVGGSAYVIIGLLQFSKKLRRNRPRMHRNLGKVFLLLSLAIGLGGIIMSFTIPLSGIMETIPTVLFGGLFLVFTVQAYRTARAKKFLEHREWVIRNFAIGLGVATIRVYAAILLYASDLVVEDLLVASFWLGWVTNMIVAEVWINATRKKAGAGRRKVA